MVFHLNRIFAKIFQVCIDKLGKMIYNVKRLLRIFVKNTKIALCIGTISLILVFLFVLSVNSECERESIPIELEMVFSEGYEYVDVVLLNSTQREICALSASLLYDPSQVSFISAEGQGILNGFDELSCVDIGGCVKLLIDNEKNDSSQKLATFRFAVIEPYRVSRIEFELIPTETTAACRFVGNTVIPLELVAPSGGRITSKHDALSVDQYSVVAVSSEKDHTVLTLQGFSFCEGFAAGFDVSVVLLATSDTQRFQAIEVLPVTRSPGHRFEHRIAVPNKGNVCVTVCPIIYNRQGVVYGKEKVFLVINGEMLG